MAREPGTFYVVDRTFTDALLKKMSNKEAVLLYLHVKENFRLKGATLGELTDMIGCASGTLNNALRALIKDGKVEERGERFFCRSATSSATKPSTKPATNLCKSPPENPVQDSLFEEHERRGRTLKSLSRAEELENRKLELLQGAFGDDFELIDEVEGRREAWLGLAPESIAGAIEKVTGFDNFRTALKRELDTLANVKAPQSAKRSGSAGLVGSAGPGRAPKSEKRVQHAQDEYKSVPAEGKTAETLLAEQERIKREDEASQPEGWTDRAQRFLEGAGRRAAAKRGGDLPTSGSGTRLGRSPPPTSQLRFNSARLGPRRDCYG